MNSVMKTNRQQTEREQPPPHPEGWTGKARAFPKKEVVIDCACTQKGLATHC